MIVATDGCDRFSGTGFCFGRDDALDARYVFTAENPPFDEQRIGGSIVGPLIRDRTHFFGSFERDNVDTVRVIALPASNPFAARENGAFPAEADNQTATARLDHRVGATNLLSVRYASDRQQSLRASGGLLSDSSQADIVNRSHSLVVEETWSARQNVANAFRIHLLTHRFGSFRGTPTLRSDGVGDRRQHEPGGLVVPVARVTASDALPLHTPRSTARSAADFSRRTIRTRT